MPARSRWTCGRGVPHALQRDPGAGAVGASRRAMPVNELATRWTSLPRGFPSISRSCGWRAWWDTPTGEPNLLPDREYDIRVVAGSVQIAGSPVMPRQGGQHDRPVLVQVRNSTAVASAIRVTVTPGRLEPQSHYNSVRNTSAQSRARASSRSAASRAVPSPARCTSAATASVCTSASCLVANNPPRTRRAGRRPPQRRRGACPVRRPAPTRTSRASTGRGTAIARSRPPVRCPTSASGAAASRRPSPVRERSCARRPRALLRPGGVGTGGPGRPRPALGHPSAQRHGGGMARLAAVRKHLSVEVEEGSRALQGMYVGGADAVHRHLQHRAQRAGRNHSHPKSGERARPHSHSHRVQVIARDPALRSVSAMAAVRAARHVAGRRRCCTRQAPRRRGPLPR